MFPPVSGSQQKKYNSGNVEPGIGKTRTRMIRSTAKFVIRAESIRGNLARDGARGGDDEDNRLHDWNTCLDSQRVRWRSLHVPVHVRALAAVSVQADPPDRSLCAGRRR